MRNTKCFKAIEGTEYDKAIKETFNLTPNWNNVTDKLSALLGEEITRMAVDPKQLRIDLLQIKNPENKKLFTKDGMLKKNLKASKELSEKYKTIVQEEGLENFRDFGYVNFTFGAMRMRGQNLESFLTLDGVMYFKADFDMNQRYGGEEKNLFLEEISEIEYEEVHLAELKKAKEQEGTNP